MSSTTSQRSTQALYMLLIIVSRSPSRTLNELRLPASLEALDKPVGLPPSLLRKAEEVRLEDGPSRIDGSFEAVEVLAEQNRAILDEVNDPSFTCNLYEWCYSSLRMSGDGPTRSRSIRRRRHPKILCEQPKDLGSDPLV